MKTGFVNSRSFLEGDHRIDPDLYLSDGAKIRREIHNLPYDLSTVGENAENVFYGNIFSRMFVSKPSHGVEYLAASDTVLSDLHTGRYISKIQARGLSYLILQKGWILVTCSGTLGNVTYTTKDFAGKLATHDLIRIIPNNKEVNAGTLYAFLSSKYGYYQITQSQFGGVVKHINESQMSSVLVPVFPESFQTEVDDLVQESARLREEANDMLEEAHKQIMSIIPDQDIHTSNSISITKIESSHNKRFDATYYNSKNRALYDYITTQTSFTTLGELTESIFRPGIFKREYVDNGVTFLGGADILRAVPSSDKKLSFRQVKKMPELIAKKGWILVTCGGTIGNTVYVDNQLKKCAISQHVMRIVPKEATLSGYLYAVLSSELGNKLINMFAFGSVIPQVEPHHLKLVPIPLLKEDKMVDIDNQVKDYVAKIELAKEKETKAIKMVEDEIEKWNNAN